VLMNTSIVSFPELLYKYSYLLSNVGTAPSLLLTLADSTPKPIIIGI